MHWGLRELRLAPQEFWRSTLRELVCLTGSPPPGAVLRQSLEQMMAQWPDEQT
jgi:uncharacterized phage protein (TIGR02216 family)